MTRRAPLVILATAGGLAGVLSFHTSQASLSLGAALGTGATKSPGTSSIATGPPSNSTNSSTTQPSSAITVAPPASSTTSSTPHTTTPTTLTPSTTTTTTPKSAVKTATGPGVNYTYGVVSVSVTVSGAKITHIGIASLDDGGNFRSQSIDQQSIPMLEQQALQAQSANIQGVSGATYTSAGFTQSLQSALSSLGFK